MKTIIHVNQHNIRHNTKNPDSPKPVFSVKRGKTNQYGFYVKISGPSELIYSPDKPLPCGAKAYIVTHSEVEIL